MEILLKNLIKLVSNTSNAFEQNTSDLKRKYLIFNINTFNYLVSLIDGNKGSFGTGYPFYALKEDLFGTLPIIKEQIRYNNELAKHIENSKRTIWGCKTCLAKNYKMMPDLKQICKPCPNMDNELKPRKIINRLPDLDMWMICEDGKMEYSQHELTKLLNKYNMRTSDIDPVQTIKDFKEISEDLQNGIMPKKFLPIDAHIIEYSKIKELINQVPSTLEKSIKNRQIPYLPIHPKSYRKTWQYDDEAYNYIYDFLSAFTAFNFTDELHNSLINIRYNIANNYSPLELYAFLKASASSSNKRRFQSIELQKLFLNKMNLWKTKNNLLVPNEIYEFEK